MSADGPLPTGAPARSFEPLRETVAQGEVAVAMSGPVDLAGTSHFSWWAIDPQTGNAVGRMGDGSGDALVEKSALLRWTKRVAMAYTLIGIVIAGPQSVEDGEILIAFSGESVIAQALSILKSDCELEGGDYGSGNSGNGGADGEAPPPEAGSSPALVAMISISQIQLTELQRF